jgi:hypothetical protein
MVSFLKNKIILLTGLILSQLVYAEVDYTKDDLRFDTAVPIVDYPETVLNKRVEFDRKIDLMFYRTNVTDELFYNNAVYSLKAGFHWDDFFSSGLIISSWQQGLNEYSEAFKNSGKQLDFTRAPAPEKSYLIYLENLYFYGKISLSPQLVLTNNLLGRYSVGMTQFATEFLPHFNYSLGFQTFFDKSYFFELGYGVSIQQIYNPISLNIGAIEPVPEKTSFSKKIQVSQNLNLGFGILF